MGVLGMPEMEWLTLEIEAAKVQQRRRKRVDMSEIVIEHIDQVSGSTAHFTAIKAWVEIIESGYGEGSVLSVSWDDAAVVAKQNGKIVGLIDYRYMKFSREVFILVGWVDSDHRRRGIYRMLYAALKQKAIELAARFISGGVTPDNQPVIAAAMALGRKAQFVTLREEIG